MVDILIHNEDVLQTFLTHEDIHLAAECVFEVADIHRDAEVSVSFVDVLTIQDLNAQWRGIDQPTDVLSFECDSVFDTSLPADYPVELGDVILAPSVIAQQAPQFGNEPCDEMRLMLVHGLCHLLGYDHMRESDALQMEEIQLAALRLWATRRGCDPDQVVMGPLTRHEHD